MKKIKTLKLTYDIKCTIRAIISENESFENGISRAIDDLIRQSGLVNGKPNIDPESIRFTIEEEK